MLSVQDDLFSLNKYSKINFSINSKKKIRLYLIFSSILESYSDIITFQKVHFFQTFVEFKQFWYRSAFNLTNIKL